MKMMKKYGELLRYTESYGDLQRATESYRDIWRATEIYGELQTAKKRLTALNPGLAGYAGEKSSEQASTITVIGSL